MQFHSHDGTWSFLKVAVVIVFIGIATWWLESRFGSGVAILVWGSLIGTATFIGGSLVAMAIQKNTMAGITKFNADDAQVDRYRMQSFKALASGESALQRAQAQLSVLDAKRVERLAQQQAKLLSDTERAKWEVRQREESQQSADMWDYENDDGDNSFAGWE